VIQPLRTAAAVAVTLAASLWVALSADLGIDYRDDAGPAIEALARGDLAAFFERQPLMGSVSLLLRAPFAAFADGSELLAYRLGAFPCVAAGGLLGLWLTRLMAVRGHPMHARAVVWALCLANPMTVNALLWGHPEEVLGGALCVAAVLVAARDRPVAAGVALGLALATKQWAVVAVAPVLLAAPGRRARLALVAAAVAGALTLPLALGGPDSFAGQARNAANTYTDVRPLSVWWPVAAEERRRVPDGVATVEIVVRSLPREIGSLPHPLIALLPIPLALLLARRREGPGPGDALGLLALVLLARCALDPVDSGYYHVPFLMALAAWEGLRRPRLPILAMVSAAVLWLVVKHVPLDRSGLANAVYLAWALCTGAALALALYAPRVTSDLGKRLRTSQPVSVTVTRSSIRTPNAPLR